MKVLKSVSPTDEQLKIISIIEPRIEIIRGAAGSGKTTTAILRLRGLIGSFVRQRRRTDATKPIRALVLTFNRTLRGYIEQLVFEQVQIGQGVDVEVDTFAHWAFHLLSEPMLFQEEVRRARIKALGATLPLNGDFLCSEVDYITGLYLPEAWDDYLDARRTGRGAVPRLDRTLRQRILNEVIRPYADWKRLQGRGDWSDMEVQLVRQQHGELYDIIIADETQDFSANQIRALLRHRADPGAVTFILDSAQRIYARSFIWRDVGINATSTNSHLLHQNYRNTKEIAALALPLVEGITSADLDASVPDLEACDREGRIPEVLLGRFSAQIAYAVEFIQQNVDLENESVAFLQPKGGKWFDATRNALDQAGLGYVEITRDREWPTGPENIALSTIYSAKGLEFDHVFLLGLNAENLEHGNDQEDDDFIRLRRLLAMGICRARETVIIGTKPEDRSDLLDLLSEGTYEEVIV